MPRIFSHILFSLPLWWIASAQAAPELPLWAAASWRNDVATVKVHLAAGTNVDEVDDWTGKTPLHYAAEYGNLEIAVLLLGAGAKARHIDDDKATALHHAAVGGFVDVARLLLAHGADINAKDKRAETPMDGAVFFGHTNVTDLLKEYYGFSRYERSKHFLLEVTALAPGWYGFLNKKMRVEARKFQILASEDLINWRAIKVLDFNAETFVYKDPKTSKYSQRFFRVAPYTEPPLKSSNLIDIHYEWFEAKPINGTLDALSGEWPVSEMVANPGFEAKGDGQRAKGTYIVEDTTYAQYVEVGDGKWEGVKDHRIMMGLGWNPEGLLLTIEVEDDFHHHTNKDATAGDSVKVLFTNDERSRVLGEFAFALSDPFLATDFIYDKDRLTDEDAPQRAGFVEQITGDAAFNVVIRRKQKTIDPSTGTTVYEFWFSPQTLGVAKLKKDLYFGLGVVVVDSDPDAPGLTGWAGWGPESVLFEAKPSEAAAVILTGDPDEGDE